MGTKRPGWTLFDIPSNPKPTDRTHQQPGRISRDTSPRPGTTAQSERERIREEEWRREREMERMKDKMRNKGKAMEPLERYSEREKVPAPRMREGERERRDRDRLYEHERVINGRPVSNLESGTVKEIDRAGQKGGTFPRMRKDSKERGKRISPIREKRMERRGNEWMGKRMDDDWGQERERERAWRPERQEDRERYRERESDGLRNRAKEEGKTNRGRVMEDGIVPQRERLRESDPGFRERRREKDLEVNDPRDNRGRYMVRERERARLEERDGRMPSPRKRRDGDVSSSREAWEMPARRDGKRDTKSEGDSDGGTEKGRVKDREKWRCQHSRSEGDDKGQMTREKAREEHRYRDQERHRERNRYRDNRPKPREEDRDGRSEKEREFYRERDRRKEKGFEEGKRRKDDSRDIKESRPADRQRSSDRKEGERYRERIDDERRCRERKTDPRRYDTTGSGNQPLGDTAATAPLQGQSSGDWSSDIDGEKRLRWKRDSHEDRESGRESTAESDQDVERDWNGGRAAEKSCGEYRTSEKPKSGGDRGQERTGPMPEQRRMWLEPQRRNCSKESSLEDEFTERERYTRRKDRKRGEEGRTESGENGGKGRENEEQQHIAHHYEMDRYRKRDGYIEKAVDAERVGVGVSVDGEEVDDARHEGHQPLSDSDGGRERNWRRHVKQDNAIDDRERERGGGSDCWTRSESEGGSDQGRDTVVSGEDGFITVSSGGEGEDEREEEEFEDCRDFWEGSHTHGATLPAGYKGHEGEMERQEEQREGNEDRSEEDGESRRQEKDKQPKYVFCVIGQTLPRSKPGMIPHLDQGEDVKASNPNTGSSQHRSDEIPLQLQNDMHPVLSRNPMNANQEAESRTDGVDEPSPKDEGLYPHETPKVDCTSQTSSEIQEKEVEDEAPSKVEHPYAEIGPATRDVETEKLLTEWRERNREYIEHSEGCTVNPYGDVDLQVIPATVADMNPERMTPEEEGSIRIRMSGAWSTEEEEKRHSQAPHLKWAKNVVREILGASDERAAADPVLGPPEGQPDGGTDKPKGGATEAVGEIPVYAVVQKSRSEDQNSGMELDEGKAEPLELEDLRDDEDSVSESWGEVDLRNVLDTIGRRKRNSKFFNAAQLYQQYSEEAQNIEILRQSRSDVISICEESPAPPRPLSPASTLPPACRPLPPIPTGFHPHSLSHVGSFSNTTTSARHLPLPEPPKNRPPSPRLSISLGQSATLWQDLPAVRNSTELGELTEDQRCLQEVRFELVTSEASYCRSLDIVVEHFVKSKQLGALLTTQDRNWLFSRLAEVRAISHSFLSKLEERVESNMLHFAVCDIIARHCQRFKMVYVPYLTNQSYQDATYQRLMNENLGFKRIVEKLERSPVCQRLPFRSFLILPFQRITRIKLLVQNIVKRTAPGTEEVMQAIKALKLLEKLIQESNDSISQMKSIESLVSLSAKVDFECRTLPLISQSRRLVREGPVNELMEFSLKDSERNVYLHLFNDYLLISLHKEGGRFTVIDHAPVSDLRAENCRVKLHSLQKNLFRLHLSNKALLLRTDAQSDKLRWISAISRPHPEVDFSAAQDFTQMQCIRAFVAQQPDELSLEKADIILVHQKSSDRWVEGTRLADRHRGWMPESHLEAIINSRVCKRNLLDALKLTTATAAV